MSQRKEKYPPYYASGLSRRNRVPAQLLPENVKIDGRVLKDDLIFSGLISDYINYYDANNMLAGSWHPLIARSNVVLFASIADTSLESIDASYNQVVSRLERRDIRITVQIKLLFNFNIGLVALLNHWYVNLTRGDESSFSDQLDSLIRNRLRQVYYNLRRIERYSQISDLSNELNLDGKFSEYSPNWLMEEESANSIDDARLLVETPVRLLQVLRNDYAVLYRAIQQIVTYGRDHLKDILEENRNRRPDTSLLTAFLKIVQMLRDEQNKITKRHLDYYYKDVLHHKIREAEPDRAVVQFQIAPEETLVQVPKHTLLSAGKDVSGRDLIYRTEEELFANQGKIAALRSLFVSRDEGDENVRPVNAIYASDDPRLYNNGDARAWWPMLGCEQDGLSPSESNMKEATIGFSIASSALYLSEGKREVRIHFLLEPDRLDENGKPSGGITQLRNYIRYVMNKEQRNFAAAVYRIFSKAFDASITTADGWFAIQRYAFNYDDEKQELEFSFMLNPADPSVTGFNAEKHGEGYATIHPVLRLFLNTHDAPHFAYNGLAPLRIRSLQIYTSADDIRGVNLFGNAGKLAPEQPFQPFGPLAMPGAYLMIGHSETFAKNLESLRVQIGWHDLPPNGFKTYFKEYPGEIGNDSFRVGFSLLQEGYFLPLRNDQQTVPLFTEAKTEHPEKGIPVSSTTVLDSINLRRLRQRASWTAPAQEDYSSATTDGYLRIELATPVQGFGSADYARVMSDTITKNAKRNSKNQIPLPNQPYMLTAASVTIGYTSTLDSATLQPGSEDVIHLYQHHPFGMQHVADGTHLQGASLIPSFEDEGYLYLGLTDVKGLQPLTFYFVLNDESLYSREEPSELNWNFLCRNNWRTIPPENLLADGTMRLIRPGIIEVVIPPEINTDNTVLSTGLSWLSVSVAKNSRLTSYAGDILTQAVEVSWVNRDNDPSHLDQPLPAGSITKLFTDIPGILKIQQPMGSYAGRREENSNDYYVRVSERLGHRQRAIQPGDFECLLIEKFPSVFKAKCFPGLGASAMPEPGKVLMVVLPSIAGTPHANMFRPKHSFAELQQMEQYLRDHSSPFISLEVRNPAYERVKVVCSVRFRRDADPGWCLSKLEEELDHFLSPWLFEEGREVEFGGSVSRSDVLGFIEKRSYVEFVTSLSIVLTMDHEGYYQVKDTARLERSNELLDDVDDADVLHAGKPWSLIVTSSQHQINVITGDTVMQPVPRGVGNMGIGDDFIIGSSEEGDTA